MSNKNRKSGKNEERKAQRVVWKLCAGLVILAIIMIGIAVYAA